MESHFIDEEILETQRILELSNSKKGLALQKRATLTSDIETLETELQRYERLDAMAAADRQQSDRQRYSDDHPKNDQPNAANETDSHNRKTDSHNRKTDSHREVDQIRELEEPNHEPNPKSTPKL